MLLKRLDIYGSKFELTINKNPNLNSTLGGVFTVFTIIIYFILGKRSLFEN